MSERRGPDNASDCIPTHPSGSDVSALPPFPIVWLLKSPRRLHLWIWFAELENRSQGPLCEFLFSSLILAIRRPLSIGPERLHRLRLIPQRLAKIGLSVLSRWAASLTWCRGFSGNLGKLWEDSGLFGWWSPWLPGWPHDARRSDRWRQPVPVPVLTSEPTLLINSWDCGQEP